jgi:hypothetical protein
VQAVVVNGKRAARGNRNGQFDSIRSSAPLTRSAQSAWTVGSTAHAHGSQERADANG